MHQRQPVGSVHGRHDHNRGTFTSGVFTLQETIYRGVTYYYYILSGNFSGSQTINGKSARRFLARNFHSRSFPL